MGQIVGLGRENLDVLDFSEWTEDILKVTLLSPSLGESPDKQVAALLRLLEINDLLLHFDHSLHRRLSEGNVELLFSKLSTVQLFNCCHGGLLAIGMILSMGVLKADESEFTIGVRVQDQRRYVSKLAEMFLQVLLNPGIRNVFYVNVILGLFLSFSRVSGVPGDCLSV